MQMTCPKCGVYSACSVLDSRSKADSIIRYRQCRWCNKNYKTIEVSKEAMVEYAFGLVHQAMEKDAVKKKVEADKWKESLKAAVVSSTTFILSPETKQEEICPKCEGVGILEKGICPKCKGTGVLGEYEEIIHRLAGTGTAESRSG